MKRLALCCIFLEVYFQHQIWKVKYVVLNLVLKIL